MDIEACSDLKFIVHPFCGKPQGGLIKDKDALKKCEKMPKNKAHSKTWKKKCIDRCKKKRKQKKRKCKKKCKKM